MHTWPGYLNTCLKARAKAPASLKAHGLKWLALKDKPK